MRLDWDDYWLGVARAVAKRSTCPRLSVGCVVTLDNKIVTTGYNGARTGLAHCTDVGCDIMDNHCMRVVHAEINALKQLTTLSSRMVLYSTHKPCPLCMEAIIKSGIREIVWETNYGVTES